MVRLFTARSLVAVGLTLGGASSAFVVTAPAASAAATPTLSPTTVQRGSPTTMSGTGCMSPAQPDNPAMVIVTGGAFVGYATATPRDGNWSMAVDVGAQIGPGSFAIKARCSYPGSGGFDYAPVTLTVVGEPLPPKPWEIPPSPGGRVGPAPTGLPTSAPSSPPAKPAPTAAPIPPPVAAASTTPIAVPATPSSPSVPTAAPGCSDCERLTGDGSVRPGEQLVLRYAGFQPGEQVTLVMHSTPVTLGAFTADETGSVTAHVTIPDTAEAGLHTLTLSGPLTGDHLIDVRVAAAPADRRTAIAPEAAGTGPVLPLVLGGLGAVVAGAGAALFLRRRRPAGPVEPGVAQDAATPIAAPMA